MRIFRGVSFLCYMYSMLQHCNGYWRQKYYEKVTVQQRLSRWIVVRKEKYHKY